MCAQLTAANAAIARLEAESADLMGRLLLLVETAYEDVASWGAYADEYFQEKWGFKDDLQKYLDYREAIAKKARKSLPSLTDHDRIQIEQAANGCVSGELQEWPHLTVALEKLGFTFTPDTPTCYLKCFCLAALTPAPEPKGNDDGR